MKNKIILLVLVFAASLLAGYMVASFLGGSKEKSQSEEQPTVQETAAEPSAPFIHDITSPTYDASSQKYSFTVTASDNTSTFCLADASGKHIPGYDRRDGHFAVPAVTGGKYHVFVKDAFGNVSEQVMVSGCSVRVKPVEARELQRLLMTKNVDAADQALKGRTARKVSYVFTNLSSEDLADTNGIPKHYIAIIERLNLGIWKAVTVDNVFVDSSGLLARATITITY